MKKQLLTAMALALLCSCGGNQNQGSAPASDSTVKAAEAEPQQQAKKEIRIIDDALIADIYKQIPKSLKNPKVNFEGKLNKVSPNLYCADRPRANYEDEDYSESLSAISCNDGGWLIIFQTSSCWEDCSTKRTIFKYNDGKLAEAKDIKLPRPAIENFVPDPFLVYKAEDLAVLKEESKDGSYYEYSFASDTMAVSFSPSGHATNIWYAFDGVIFYIWDGEKYVEAQNQKPNTDYTAPIVSGTGLGGIKLGDPVHEDVPGFDYKAEANNMFSYSRNGVKYFDVHADKNGFINQINVYNKAYTSNYGEIGKPLANVGYSEFPVEEKDGKFYKISPEYGSYNVVKYVSSKADGNCEYMTIMELEPDPESDDITEKIYFDLVQNYSQFTNDESNPSIEDGKVYETRHSRYCEEEFTMIAHDWLHHHYVTIAYSTSFQGEDDEEGTYNRGVDAFEYKDNKLNKVSSLEYHLLKTFLGATDNDSVAIEYYLDRDGVITCTLNGKSTKFKSAKGMIVHIAEN